LNESLYTQNEAGEWVQEPFQDVLVCLQTDPLVRGCIDGWLLQEELDDPWYELLLFRPSEIVDPSYMILHYTPEEIETFNQDTRMRGGFPYDAYEREKLRLGAIQMGHLRYDGQTCQVVWD
jgi:hypothetical protein